MKRGQGYSEGEPRQDRLPELFRADEVTQTVRELLKMLAENPENKDPQVLHRRFNNYFSTVAFGWLRNYPDLFRQISEIQIHDPEQFAQEVGQRFEALIRDTVPKEQIIFLARGQERAQRYLASRHKGRKTLSDSDMLQYEWSQREPKVVRIHVQSAKTLSLSEKRAEFMAGMSELAKRVETDPQLHDVDTVLAPSWIVAAHSKLVESLGFTIDDEGLSTAEKERLFPDEDRPIGVARMSRDELIRRYKK